MNCNAALVADKGTRASCAHILNQRKLARFLEAEQLLKLYRAHPCDFPEVLAEGRWTNIRILCEFVDADGLGELLLDMRRLHDLLSGVILYRTMSGQDIVYTNLTGDDIDKQARTSRMRCA